jgi:hypothetical protein
VTRLLVVLGAVVVAGLLLAASALVPSSSGGCPDTGDPVGRPITNPAERARILDTFSAKTIDACWPGTLADSRQ